MRTSDETDAWERALSRASDLSLRDIAASLGVRPGEVAARLVAHRSSGYPALPATSPAGEARAPAAASPPIAPPPVSPRGVVSDLPGSSSGPVVPEDAPAARPFSKDQALLEHWDILGRLPDAEVARRAAVSVRTVASFRSRNGIPGFAGPRRTSKFAARRTSKVDTHAYLLGQVPDRIVADRARVSLNAVRNYRTKNNIPAAPRRRAARADVAELAAPPDRSTEVVEPASGQVPVVLQAFEVVLQRGADTETRVVVAVDMAGAVAAAARDGAHLLSVRHLAPVL